MGCKESDRTERLSLSSYSEKKKKKTQYKLDAIVLSISLVLSKAYKTSLSIEKEFLSHKSIDTQG